MKRFIMFWLLMLPLGFAGFADASAQSLAEVAKKEKERRKAVGKAEVRTYDDSSLGGRGRSVQFVPAADDSGTDAGQVDEAAEEAQEEDPTETQAYWRDRKASIEKRISDIEAQLNHPGFSQDPDNLMRRSNLERQLQQARSDLSALQAEARRKGIPPGWVR